MKSVEQIEQRAAEWLARCDSDTWSPNDQVALDQWLNESTDHVVAFVRLESAWTRADRFKALGAGFPKGKVPTPEEFNLPACFGAKATQAGRVAVPYLDELRRDTLPVPECQSAIVKASTRRFPVPGAQRMFGQGIVLALMMTVAWFNWPACPDYKTPIGGTASVPMADGSKITLNTDSAIRVALTKDERDIKLDQGEAFFEVAHDPSRPFVVRAGNKRVIAVGTKFAVRRVGDDLRVFVKEGKVRVEVGEGSSLPAANENKGVGGAAYVHAASPAFQTRRAGEGPNKDITGEVFLAAGGIARTDGEGILVKEESLTEVEDSLSWRTGYIIFHESTLADAIAEFNRYNVRKIFIDDAEVASIKISGKFRTTDFESFVRLIEGGFALHIRQSSARIVLVKN